MQQTQKMMKPRRKALGYMGLFLAVVLLLTMLTTTLHTLSIAQVETVSPLQTSLLRTLEAQGVVRASVETPILINELFVQSGILVDHVETYVGARIEAGDPILRLNVEQLEKELEDAKTELKKQQLAHDKFEIPTVSDIDPSLTLEKAAKDREIAQRKRENSINSAGDDVVAAEEALEDAKLKLKKAEAKLDEVQNHGPSADRAAIDAAQEAVYEAQKNVKTCERALEKAKDTKEEAVAAANDEIWQEDYESRLLKAEAGQQAAQKDAAAKQNAIDEQLHFFELNSWEEKVELLQKTVEADGVIFAASPGVVTSVDAHSGSPVALKAVQIAPAGGDLILRCSASKEQTKYFSPGDPAVIQFQEQDMDDIETIIREIHSVAGSDTMADVTAELNGTKVRIGATASIRVLKKTAAYDCVVPLEAMRSDENGAFVLVVRERKDGWGGKFYAERIQVRILDQDSQYAAVEGMLRTGDDLISKSNKSVQDGDSVQAVRQ